MDPSLDVPDDLAEAARRALLVFSAATLGGMALPGLVRGEPFGALLLGAAAVVASASLPVPGERLRRNVGAIAAATALFAWLVVLPLFDGEAIVVPGVMALGCAVLLRAAVPAPAVEPSGASLTTGLLSAGAEGDGWIEEDGRRIWP